MIPKGAVTRQAILEKALALASRKGLEGITIGRLSQELGLSKSGLFAHFRSKDALQVQVLQQAAAHFVDEVVRPALGARRGEPRVRALFDRWLDWARSQRTPGGCPFVAAAIELDDQPGPARDELVRTQRDWLETVATCFRTGITEGQFASTAEPEQFAHDFNGIMLAYHHAARLLADPSAEARARTAFESLLAAARPRAGAARPAPATRAAAARAPRRSTT
jgi:AcrR family transcriptional regulator